MNEVDKKIVDKLLSEAQRTSFDAIFRVIKEARFVLHDEEYLCENSIWLGPDVNFYTLKPGIYGAWGLRPDLVGPVDKHLLGEEHTTLSGFEIEELEALEEMGYIEFIVRP